MKLRQMLRAEAESGTFTGWAYSVIKKGVSVDRGLGGTTALGGAPVREGTLFDLGSLTKPMVTATLIGQLVHEGEVSLDSPMSELLSGFPWKDKDRPTVGMLLNHTSGLRASMPLYRSARSVEGAIRLIVESGWEYEGGKREIYSDLGYIILGELVSALSGEGLDSVASKRIFVPLGMTSTAYRPDSKRFSIVETEHYADRECGPGLVHDENCFFLGGVTGHAGLFSCLADIEKYVFGVMAKAGAVFPPSSYHMFFDASNLRMGGTHSYGWQLKSGDDSFGKYFHDGSIGHTGYPGTGLWMDLSAGFATILLTNRVYYGRDPTKIAVVRCRFNELACESFGE